MRLVIAAIASATLLLGAFAVMLARDERPPSLSSAAAGLFRGSEVPARFPMPAFSLHDYTSAAVSSASLRGHVVVLTFLDTKCKEACPIIAGQLARTAALLTAAERRQVDFVAITSDPRVDTPAAIRAFLRRHQALGIVRYLSGPISTLRKLWHSFQILSALESGNADTHSAPVRIYSREGIWLATQHAGADLTPDNLAHDIRVALRP